MIPFDPVAALALPEGALVDRRVPKTLLIENGAPTAADRRRIREGVEELRWVAALKPTTISVAEYRDAAREYIEIDVLKLVLRSDAGADRLVELVHRAVPYPVVLVAWRGDVPEFSLAHKRRSRGEAGKIVIDGEITSARLSGDCPHEFADAFGDALALTRQPRETLHAFIRAGSLRCSRCALPWSPAYFHCRLPRRRRRIGRRRYGSACTWTEGFRKYAPLPAKRSRSAAESN